MSRQDAPAVTAIDVTLREVAVLFARADSIYKQLPGCNVFDRERGARCYSGGSPIVAHPPCRAWARFKGIARPEPGEELDAVWAVRMVRENGGVLEHPALSCLWKCCRMAEPGDIDAEGGWTHVIHQRNFGHKADKATWLYIVGVRPADLPPEPFTLAYATHTVSSHRKYKRLPEVSHADRERTPPALADWLVEVARRSQV